jgi:hypothetical protein
MSRARSDKTFLPLFEAWKKSARARKRLDAEYEELTMNTMRLELHSLSERRELNKLIRERKHERGYIV